MEKVTSKKIKRDGYKSPLVEGGVGWKEERTACVKVQIKRYQHSDDTGFSSIIAVCVCVCEYAVRRS